MKVADKWKELTPAGKAEAVRLAKWTLKVSGLSNSEIVDLHTNILLTCATNEVYNIPQYRK